MVSVNNDDKPSKKKKRINGVRSDKANPEVHWSIF